MGSALVERTQTAELEALAAFVAAEADHNQIVATGGGALAAERDGHPEGTPYVTVTVPTVAAAELAEGRLEGMARIPAGRWRHGWRRVADGLALDIYPDLDETPIATFVALAVAERRRPDLEALVQSRLADAPDVAVVDSGTVEGNGYVDIAVATVDGTDRAQRALASIGSLSADEWAHRWTWDRDSFRLRFYPGGGSSFTVSPVSAA